MKIGMFFAGNKMEFVIYYAGNIFCRDFPSGSGSFIFL